MPFLASLSTLFSPHCRSCIAFNPLLYPLLYLSQPLMSPSPLDDIIQDGSPGYSSSPYRPYLCFPLSTRFLNLWNLPSIGPSPSWLIPHFFLIPVLESWKDNLDIQVKCRDL